MLIKTLISELSKYSQKIPIRLVLVVPFTLEIFIAVGLTGWLSIRNGQNAINEVAHQLRSEISARIQLHLETYLSTPILINQLNADSYAQGQININNLPSLERHFLQQMQRFNSVSYISLGTEKGEFIGIQRTPQNFRIVVTDKSTNGAGYHYETDSKGNRNKLIQINPNYDPRKRPWYQKAKQAKQAIWTEIYPVFAEQQLTITAGLPVYDKTGNLNGVFITDLVLSQIDEFLRSLKIGKTGQTFIIERTGMLVASSTSQKPFSLDKGSIQRIQATQTNNTLIRATADHLQQLYSLNFIGKNCPQDCHIDTSFLLNKHRYFVKITPLLSAYKTANTHHSIPDWLIVVILPESDFTEQIEANRRNTILLCSAAFFIALLLGLITSSWIVKPILRLNSAATALAQGDWHQVVPVERLLELNMLGRTFNKMTQQLRLLYSDLEANVVELMQVQDTLRRKEANYRELVQNANSMIVRLDTTGHITFFNEFAQSFFGYAEHEILGQNILGTIVPRAESSGRNLVNLIQNLLENPEQYSRNENENIRRNGERVWVSWTTKALRDPKGNLTGLLCIGTDISERKRAEDALFKRERYLNAIVEVQRRLLANHDTSHCYAEILEPLGQASGASRVYLFENHRDPKGQLLASQHSEWCAPSIQPEIANPSLQNLPLETYFPRWIPILSAGEPIAGFVRNFPVNERQLLEPQGIISILILPLIVEGEFCGFIGFDNCIHQTLWEPLEIDLLRAAAAAFALNQERIIAQQALQKAKAALEIRVRERTAELAQSETRFRRLSEATFEGIVVHEGTTILDSNEAFARMFGYQTGEQMPSQILDYIAPESHFVVLEKIAAGLETPYELTALKKDKSRFPIEIEAKIIPYQGAQVRVVALRDITERKAAERALRESEQKFSTAFRQSPNAITITTIPDGNLVDVSDGFLKMTGYTRSEVIGCTTLELNLWVHPENRQQIQQIIRQEGSLRNQEIEFRRKFGEIIVGLLSAERITLGGIDCILTVTSDITERKKAQEALARALKEQESIFEAQQDIIFVFDLDLKLIKWNKQMEIVTGLTADQLKGRSALCFFLKEDQETIARGIQEALANTAPASWTEGHLIAKDGVLLDYQFSGVPLKDEKGNVIGFTGAGRNITEAKRAAAILQIEQQNSEKLLLNILPKAIAERLKQQIGPIAESFPDTTVLFADIVGFTQLSAQISPQELVEMLNQIFSSFDQLADRHGLEKIKTIGDAYMAVSGVPIPRLDHAEAVANMALDMQKEVERLAKETGFSFNIRIGINTGSVVAGVIGLKKFIYDLWGDTVNTASRMESHGIPGTIQVSESTYFLLRDKYTFQERGIIYVKGKGDMLTYLLIGKINSD